MCYFLGFIRIYGDVYKIINNGGSANEFLISWFQLPAYANMQRFIYKKFAK